MHAQQFDEPTRAVATGASRRTVLKTMAGDLAGALLTALGHHAAQAQGGPPQCRRVHQPCGADAPCCGHATSDAESRRCVCLVQFFCAPGFHFDRSTCQCVAVS